MNWLHLKGQSIDWTERIKTCLRSVGGRTYGKPDERINPSDAGRMTRNWVKVFRIHKWMQSMIGHSLTTSESWKNLSWKQFQKTLFRLIELDIEKCFDRINHSAIMDNLIAPARLKLGIFRCLKAGTNIGFPDQGTPQGGVVSPLLANIALNGIESIHGYKGTDSVWREPSIRYADDMVIILRPEDNAEAILNRISEFLAKRGMNVSERKTKITATTDGFDFLGWNFKVQKNGKFRSVPSVENYKAFRKKVKHIVNNSNYGATLKAMKLALVARGWRNHHKYCKMDGSRNSLYFIQKRAFTVFNKETKQNRYTSKILLKKAFPTVSHSENKHINVKCDSL